jgi:hypothetical protein
MRNALIFLCCVGVFRASLIGHAASFQNLNFDSANTNNIFDSSGAGHYAGLMTELMPGWTLVGGTDVAIFVGFNRSQPGSGYATIISPTYVNAYPVIGPYSFAMLPKYDVQGTFVPYSLSQSGTMPADAKSIHFLSYGAPVQLGVNGSLVPVAYAQRPSDPAWNGLIPVFDAAADISPYAGQSVELKFTTLLIPNYQGLNGLDQISFSEIAIPEPSTLALLLSGALILSARLRGW